MLGALSEGRGLKAVPVTFVLRATSALLNGALPLHPHTSTLAHDARAHERQGPARTCSEGPELGLPRLELPPKGGGEEAGQV